MHTYKNVIIEQEMNWLLIMPKINLVPVLLESANCRQVGTAELRENQHCLFADISSSESLYGMFPEVEYTTEEPVGNILSIIIKKSKTDGSAVKAFDLSVQEFADLYSDKGEADDRYHR